MFGICVAVNASTSTSSRFRYATLKLWKSRPAAPAMMIRCLRTCIRSMQRPQDGKSLESSKEMGRFQDALNEQIGREFAASQQYAGIARDENDLVGEQFLHWFLEEQREEVASMSSLLAVVQRAQDNLLLVEEYLARTSVSAAEPSGAAPAAAGGAL